MKRSGETCLPKHGFCFRADFLRNQNFKVNFFWSNFYFHLSPKNTIFSPHARSKTEKRYLKEGRLFHKTPCFVVKLKETAFYWDPSLMLLKSLQEWIFLKLLWEVIKLFNYSTVMTVSTQQFSSDLCNWTTEGCISNWMGDQDTQY